MSLRLTQRQLDALRADAIEEGRRLESKDQIQRSFDRGLARQRWDGPAQFATWADAREGTVLLGTEDGRSLYKADRVERIIDHTESTGCGFVREGELWVVLASLDGGGRSGIRVVEPKDRILVIPNTLGPR